MKWYHLSLIIGTIASKSCLRVNAAQLVTDNNAVTLINKTQACLNATIGTDENDLSCITIKKDEESYTFSAEALQDATWITLVSAGRACIIAVWQARGQTLTITEKDFSGKKQVEQELDEKS